MSPGHSAVDFEMAEGGRRLEVVNILTDDGNLNAVSEEFAGLPRFDARTSLAHRLSALGLYRGRFSIGETTDFLAKVAPMRLPICSRSGDIIEPLLREQWFIDTSTMVAAASEASLFRFNLRMLVCQNVCIPLSFNYVVKSIFSQIR